MLVLVAPLKEILEQALRKQLSSFARENDMQQLVGEERKARESEFAILCDKIEGSGTPAKAAMWATCLSKWAYAQTAALEGCLTLAPGSEAAVWDN